MPPRPFYLSRLFWLGMPALVFLMWGWWDSGGCHSYAMWVRGSDAVRGDIREGYIKWTRGRYLSATGKTNYTVAQRYEMSDPTSAFSVGRRRQFDFPVAFHRATEMGRDGARRSEISTVRVALWAIVAGYVAVWFAMDFWWQWRKSRVIAASATIDQEASL